MPHVILKKAGIFLLLLVWFLSGFPVIWQNPRFPPEISKVRAATSFIGTSNLIATNGSAPGAITPNANTQNGDLLVFYHYSRATGGNETVALSGFTFPFNSVIANRGLVAVGWRIKQAGDSVFTATITNHKTGGSGETVLEWIETYRGFDPVNPIVDFTPALSNWNSSLNMGPIAPPTPATVRPGDMVVVYGGRFENIKSQTVLSGDSLSWSTRTLNNIGKGSDAAAVTQNGINSTGTNQTVTAKTITTTGTAQAGAGRMFIIRRAPDITAPAPNPMTFSTPPANDSAAQISMTATTAIDETSPVSYFFANNNSTCGANAGTGGTSSSWQPSITYSDNGLQINKCYGYTAAARDGVSPTPNTGSASAVFTTYTSANIPGAPTLSAATPTSLRLTNAENSNPSSNPTTYFAVQVVTTTPTDSVWFNKWVNAAGDPSSSEIWMSDAQLDALTIRGLQSSTIYGVKVKARNQDNDETALSAVGQGTTQAAPVISVAITSDGSISYGIVPAGARQDTTSTGLKDTQIVKNDGNVVEDFNIKTSNATGGTLWTLGSSPGSNVFTHEFSVSSGSAWLKFGAADTYQSLVSSIPVNGLQDFDLRITVPTSSSDYQKKNIVVTIQAVQH